MIKEQVAAGARKLDEVVPGWHLRVDLNKLDMQHTSNCVLGQVYGGYMKGLDRLNLRVDEPSWTYGFTTFMGDDIDVWGKNADHYWREEIEQRRA